MARQLVHEQITGVIRQTAFEVHRYFGSGFLEKVYENSMANRLRKKGLSVSQQHKLEVLDEDGTVVGEYKADLYVESLVLVEIKAVDVIARAHVAQTINYVKACRQDVGVLVNFGSTRLEFKRFVGGQSLREVEATGRQAQ